MTARPVMRIHLRPLLTVLLAAAVAAPSPIVAQETPPPADPAKAAASALAGSWSGWATIANDWPDLPCRYEGAAGSESVHLELMNDGGLVHGSVSIDLPAESGTACPALRKRFTIGEVSTGGGSVSFTDSGGNEWTLSQRRSGNVLQGMLAWRAGGTDQPLAEGFTTKQGVRPLARLAGEVQLRKAGAPAEPATPGATESAVAPASAGVAAAAPAAAPQKTGAGGHLKNLGLVLGANVVGFAALYGINQIGKGKGSQGAVTCSPRVCVVGAPNAPCLCYNEIIIGASCGETPTGLAEGETGCDGGLRPCAANLSCNLAGVSGICQGENGRCAF